LLEALSGLGIESLFEVGIVSHARGDEWADKDSPRSGKLAGYTSNAIEPDKFLPPPRVLVGGSALRRTPRKSLILVLPDDPVAHPDRVASCLSSGRDDETDVTIACAGQPNNLDALKRIARTARFLLAPSGTSTEELRELAMEQTPGDIVTLLDGADLCQPVDSDHLVAS
jgi:hypothetical protein